MALKGEFESTLAIDNAVPGFAPKPLDWGSFKSLDNTHYYLCKFHKLSLKLPPEAELTEKLARLHKNGTSPNGRFGFHVVTYNGNMPQDNSWADTWLNFFINGFEHILRVNVECGGPWEEMEQLKPHMISKVIPRLLKPMEIGRHSVDPVLVHGDLWCGNTAVDTELNQPVVYDPSSFYAHNECKVVLMLLALLTDYLQMSLVIGGQNVITSQTNILASTMQRYRSHFRNMITMIETPYTLCKLVSN